MADSLYDLSPFPVAFFFKVKIVFSSVVPLPAKYWVAMFSVSELSDPPPPPPPPKKREKKMHDLHRLLLFPLHEKYGYIVLCELLPAKVQLFSLYKIYDNCMHCHYIFNCFMFVHQMQCFVFIVFSKCIALASLVIAFLWPQGLELIWLLVTWPSLLFSHVVVLWKEF